MVEIKNFNFIPAYFTQVEAPQSPAFYSRGKLYVFYIGETADHRVFTQSFSNQLIKSLPYTPVVSYYNEETEDFEGHSSEQSIYGIVDPMVPVQYVERDGATWCVCDVILYTKRPDKVGEIAAKIPGHPQSLELDVDTLKYKINRDAQGNFKNLEFMEGNFVGLSVLGKNETPAFTGSQFFEALPPELFTRGKGMTLKIQEFAKLSWGEQVQLIVDELIAKYGDNFWYVCDVYDGSIVYRAYNPEDEKIHMYRCKYKLADEKATLTSEPEEVHPSYEKMEADPAIAAAATEEPTPAPAEMSAQTEPAASEDPAAPEEQPAPAEADPATATMSVQPEATPEVAPEQEAAPVVEAQPGNMTEQSEPVTTPESVSEPQPEQPADELTNPENASLATDTAGEESTNVQESQPSTVASLSNAERLELEAYRKEAKLALIASYSDMLTESDCADLTNNVDNYGMAELKSLLDARYVEASRKAKQTGPTAFKKGFNWIPTNTNGNASKSGNELADYIGGVLNK